MHKRHKHKWAATILWRMQWQPMLLSPLWFSGYVGDVLVKPFHVAEILAMRQVGVLREHAHACLETASQLWCLLELEGVVVAFVSHHLELVHAEDPAVA